MQFYVKDIMSTDIVSIKSDFSIRDLIKTFADYNVMGLPVIDDEGIVVGVVSSIDVLKNESSHSFYYEPYMRNFEANVFKDASFFDQPVASIMTEDLFTIEPDASIAKMSKIMYEQKIHRLLVTEYNKLIGVVTTFDLLKLLASSDEQIELT